MLFRSTRNHLQSRDSRLPRPDSPGRYSHSRLTAVAAVRHPREPTLVLADKKQAATRPLFTVVVTTTSTFRFSNITELSYLVQLTGIPLSLPPRLAFGAPSRNWPQRTSNRVATPACYRFYAVYFTLPVGGTSRLVLPNLYRRLASAAATSLGIPTLCWFPGVSAKSHHPRHCRCWVCSRTSAFEHVISYSVITFGDVEGP